LINYYLFENRLQFILPSCLSVHNVFLAIALWKSDQVCTDYQSDRLPNFRSNYRKLFQIWNERAELPNKQLVRSLPYIFHDMDVYPSRSQVHEMIHCANDCSRRKNGDYLTFGEFCVYASELKSCYDNKYVIIDNYSYLYCAKSSLLI